MRSSANAKKFIYIFPSLQCLKTNVANEEANLYEFIQALNPDKHIETFKKNLKPMSLANYFKAILTILETLDLQFEYDFIACSSSALVLIKALKKCNSAFQYHLTLLGCFLTKIPKIQNRPKSVNLLYGENDWVVNLDFNEVLSDEMILARAQKPREYSIEQENLFKKMKISNVNVQIISGQNHTLSAPKYIQHSVAAISENIED